MKHTRVSLVGWLALSLLLAALLVAPVWGQEQVFLRSVRPSKGQPGQELDLALEGGGFGGANWASVSVGELEVRNVRVESDSVIRALVYIPEHAQPGPRDVTVVVSFGQNEEFSAVLPGGFSVEGVAEPPPGPSGPGPGEPGEPPPGEPGEFPPGEPYPGDLRWLPILVVALVALALVGVAGGVALRMRRSAQQRQWQTEAQEGELPETCQRGILRVKREKPKLKPGRWKVTGLKATLYDAERGRRGATRDVPAELAKRIDEAARDRMLWGDSEKLSAEAASVGRELAALIVAWQSLSDSERDVYLEPRIEGGEASVKFTLYRCVGQPGRWKRVRDWEAKLKAVDHFPRGFRGPRQGEAAEAYRVFVEGRLSGYVRELIQEAGRLV